MNSILAYSELSGICVELAEEIAHISRPGWIEFNVNYISSNHGHLYNFVTELTGEELDHIGSVLKKIAESPSQGSGGEDWREFCSIAYLQLTDFRSMSELGVEDLRRTSAPNFCVLVHVLHELDGAAKAEMDEQAAEHLNKANIEDEG